MSRKTVLAVWEMIAAADDIPRGPGWDESVARAYRAAAVAAVEALESVATGDAWVGAAIEVEGIEPDKAVAMIQAIDTLGVVNMTLKTDDYGTWKARISLWGASMEAGEDE